MIAGLADIEAIERTPLDRQLDAWTVPDLLARGASIDPAKAALHYLEQGGVDEPAQTLNFGQLAERVRQAAGLFRSLGVGEGDAVAILLPTVPQNYIALLGAAAAGIGFPINWMIEPSQIGELLESGRAKVLVALGPTPGYDIWEKTQAIRGRFGSSLQVLQVKGPGGSVDAELDFDRRCQAMRAAPGRAPAPDATAFYIHTGGTTGKPKIARITHRGVAYKSWAIALLTGLDPAQTAFGVSPLFHIGGIVLKAIAPLSRGLTLVIPGAAGFRNKSLVRDYWKLVERFRVTELAGVPTVLGALAAVPVDGADISSLRELATTGSSALPTAIGDHFEKTLGIRILADYGMTEATATVTLPPRDGPRKDGANGIRLPFTEVRIAAFDPAGRIARECGTDEIGEIIVRGPGVIAGYVDDAAQKGVWLDGGWIRSGDLGRLDGDGYLWVTGRVKDLIIRGGHNIDPRMIEETLMAYEGVGLAAAVGKPDAYAGELPVAFVQAKPGAKLDPDALVAFARSRIAERAAAPVEVFVLDALPLTGVGKIAKQELRERALLRVMAGVVAERVPPASFAGVAVRPHPTRGSQVVVTLLAGPMGPDAEVEHGLRQSLGRFAHPYAIDWQENAQ